MLHNKELTNPSLADFLDFFKTRKMVAALDRRQCRETPLTGPLTEQELESVDNESLGSVFGRYEHTQDYYEFLLKVRTVDALERIAAALESK